MKTNTNFYAILVLSYLIIALVGFSTVSEANANLFCEFEDVLVGENNQLAKTDN